MLKFKIVVLFSISNLLGLAVNPIFFTTEHRRSELSS